MTYGRKVRLFPDAHYGSKIASKTAAFTSFKFYAEDHAKVAQLTTAQLHVLAESLGISVSGTSDPRLISIVAFANTLADECRTCSRNHDPVDAAQFSPDKARPSTAPAPLPEPVEAEFLLQSHKSHNVFYDTAVDANFSVF